VIHIPAEGDPLNDLMQELVLLINRQQDPLEDLLLLYVNAIQHTNIN